MKDSQHPESSQSSTTRDDIFTQVMGEDRRGQVRTFGLGVTPSDIYGSRASIAEARAAAVESARIAEMERAQRIALQEEVVQMRTQLNQLMTWMQSFTGSGPSSSSSSVPLALGFRCYSLSHPARWLSIIFTLILWFYQCSHWVQLLPLLMSYIYLRTLEGPTVLQNFVANISYQWQWLSSLGF